LDALRGLAALAVVMFHYTTRYDQLYGHVSEMPAVPSGHYGVQLFFCISGFVIFMTLDRCRSLTDFAVSRFSRLFPAYWVAIGLTTLFVTAGGMAELIRTPEEIFVNLSMMQSYLHVEAVDGVYWTLSIELAFYCAAAILWRLGLMSRIEPILLAWIGLRWIWTFSPALTGVELSWLVGSLLIQQHIPFFALGIAAYRLRSRAASAGRVAGIAVAALLTIGVCDGVEPLIVGIISAGAIFTVALAPQPLLSTGILVRLGAISYSLYLLHQYIGFTLISGIEAAGVPSIVAVGLTLGFVILLAALVTYGIEQPILRRIRHGYRSWQAGRSRDNLRQASST
jgi:peptidoglycan/LPS O-acetylase OafA/YrhL